jgi:hypothetical protein
VYAECRHEALYDDISELVYGSVRTGIAAGGGAFGARADMRADLLPSQITVRVAHRVVPLETTALAEHNPTASGRCRVPARLDRDRTVVVPPS